MLFIFFRFVRFQLRFFLVSQSLPLKPRYLHLSLSEYTDSDSLIPKGSSVIVRRIPSSSSKTHNKWVYIFGVAIWFPALLLVPATAKAPPCLSKLQPGIQSFTYSFEISLQEDLSRARGSSGY